MHNDAIVDFADIDDLLDVIKDPIKQIRFRLAELDEAGLDLDYDKGEGIGLGIKHRLFSSLYAKLKNMYNKIRIVHQFWTNSEATLTDEEIRGITIGFNYDIHDITYTAFRLGVIYLPFLRQNSEVVRNFSEVMKQYSYKATLAAPTYYNEKRRAKFKIEISPSEKEAFTMRGEIPSIQYGNNYVHFSVGTAFTMDNIKNGLPDSDPTDILHPGLALLVGISNNIRDLLTRLTPDVVVGTPDITLQQLILECIMITHRWKETVIMGLLKDDQVLKKNYQENYSDLTRKKSLPFRLWKENQVNDMINPSIMTSPSIC